MLSFSFRSIALYANLSLGGNKCLDRTRLSASPSWEHSSKQTFTSTSLASLLSFELQATPDSTLLTRLLNTLGQNPLKDKFTAQVPAPTPLEKTAQQLHQWLYKRAITVESHHCLSILSHTLNPASHSSQISLEAFTAILEAR